MKQGFQPLRQLHPAEVVAEYTDMGLWGAQLWPQMLAEHTRAMPDRLAVADPSNYAAITGKEPVRLTWAELSERVFRLAAVLLDGGVSSGDVVALQLPNGVDIVTTYLAVASLGAVATPFPVQYREFELAQMCELSSAAAFVTTTRVGDHPTVAWARSTVQAVPSLKQVFAFGPNAPDDVVSIDDAMTNRDLAALEAYRARLDIDANDAVTLCWTSGTESRPKGVPRCPNDWWPMALSSVESVQMTAHDVLLNPFPMVNMAGVGGMLVPWLISGATLVQHHPFDALLFLEQLSKERVTYTVAAPTLLLQLLHRPEVTTQSMASVRVIASGSAPLPPSMITGFKERFDIDILNTFGSNEGASMVSDPRSVPDPVMRASLFPRVGSPTHRWANRATHGIRSKLVDPSTGGEIAEPGVPGELRLKGPGVFAGYLAGTAERSPFDDDGFLMTGDLFQFVADEAGDVRFLQYVDRAKDVIIRGGMKISPAELEGLLAAHPKVAEVAVVGVPDSDMGERTHVVVVPRGDETPTLAELLDHLRRHRIASFKLPQSVSFVPALPRNAVGKILKRELRVTLSGGTT